MQKVVSNFPKIFFLLFLVFFFNHNFTLALSVGKNIGGTVFATKAIKIKKAEDDGFICVVPGKTVEMTLKNNYGVKMQQPYFIPALTVEENKNILKINQYIMLKTSGKTTIKCTRPEPPETRIFYFDTVTEWGTSKNSKKIF